MKLTVLSILILLLVAGLAMIQMDANTKNQSQVTENQIQVLRETEMLTTQGLGICEEVVNNPATTGRCADVPCKLVGIDGFGSQAKPVYVEHTAVAYNKCDNYSINNITNCVQKQDQHGNPIPIPCAEVRKYHWACINMYQFDFSTIDENDVENVPGCAWGLGGGGGGGGTGGDTTS